MTQTLPEAANQLAIIKRQITDLTAQAEALKLTIADQMRAEQRTTYGTTTYRIELRQGRRTVPNAQALAEQHPDAHTASTEPVIRPAKLEAWAAIHIPARERTTWLNQWAPRGQSHISITFAK